MKGNSARSRYHLTLVDEEYPASYQYPWTPESKVSAEWFFGPGITELGLRKIRSMWIDEFSTWPPKRNSVWICSVAPEAFYPVYPLWWMRKINCIIIREDKWLAPIDRVDKFNKDRWAWKCDNIWRTEDYASGRLKDTKCTY